MVIDKWKALQEIPVLPNTLLGGVALTFDGDLLATSQIMGTLRSICQHEKR